MEKVSYNTQAEDPVGILDWNHVSFCRNKIKAYSSIQLLLSSAPNKLYAPTFRLGDQWCHLADLDVAKRCFEIAVIQTKKSYSYKIIAFISSIEVKGISDFFIHSIILSTVLLTTWFWDTHYGVVDGWVRSRSVDL